MRTSSPRSPKEAVGFLIFVGLIASRLTPFLSLNNFRRSNH
jgi:hypothetical protein